MRESLFHQTRSTSSPSLAPTISISSFIKTIFSLAFLSFFYQVLCHLYHSFPNVIFSPVRASIQRNLVPGSLPPSLIIFVVPLIYWFFILSLVVTFHHLLSIQLYGAFRETKMRTKGINLGMVKIERHELMFTHAARLN